MIIIGSNDEFVQIEVLEEVKDSALLMTALGVDSFADEVNILPGMEPEVSQKGSDVLTPAMPMYIS